MNAAGFFLGGVGLRGLLEVLGLLALLGTVAGWYGEYAWWLDAWVHFKVGYVAIFCLVALFQALARRWVVAGAAVALAAWNLVPLWPYVSSGAGRRDADIPSGSVRAMMVNVNTFYGDASRVAGAIRDEGPDILLLLEVDRRWLAKLGPELEGFARRVMEPREDNFGIALFSKVPWEAAGVVFIGEANLPSVQARLAIGGEGVWVLGTHAPPPLGHRLWALRNDQLAELARHARAIEGPLLVLGDLNATPWSYHMGRLLDASGLRDSAVGRRLMGTWPVLARPFSIPIDHCLYRGGIEIHGRKHGPDVGSDHLPLVVDFGVAQGSRTSAE